MDDVKRPRKTEDLDPRVANEPRSRRPRVAQKTEHEILAFVFMHPGYGQDRVARELNDRGSHVSASGVRYVLLRNNMETLEKRVQKIEAKLGTTGEAWSREQAIAREKVQAGRRSRAIAANLTGEASGDVRRSEYILAIAARLIREQGYEATSLRDVANQSHIPLGSLYYHFRTKDELFGCVYEKGVRHLTDAVEDALARENTPWQRLEAACLAHLQCLCGGDDFTAVAIPTNLPRLERRIRQKLIVPSDHYENIFRRLIGDLQLPPDIDPKLLRLQILGALNWTSSWYRPGGASPDAIGRNLINALRIQLDQNGSAP